MFCGLKERDLDVLPSDKARELLLEIAPRIGSSADSLADMCGCLPLALRNAASALIDNAKAALEIFEQIESPKSEEARQKISEWQNLVHGLYFTECL